MFAFKVTGGTLDSSDWKKFSACFSKQTENPGRLAKLLKPINLISGLVNNSASAPSLLTEQFWPSLSIAIGCSLAAY